MIGPVLGTPRELVISRSGALTSVPSRVSTMYVESAMPYKVCGRAAIILATLGVFPPQAANKID